MSDEEIGSEEHPTETENKVHHWSQLLLQRERSKRLAAQHEAAAWKEEALSHRRKLGIPTGPTFRLDEASKFARAVNRHRDDIKKKASEHQGSDQEKRTGSESDRSSE